KCLAFGVSRSRIPSTEYGVRQEVPRNDSETSSERGVQKRPPQAHELGTRYSVLGIEYHGDHPTTRFTSFPGTTITFLIDLLSSRALILSSFFAACSSASFEMPAGTTSLPLTLPLICTGTSMVSALSRLAS